MVLRQALALARRRPDAEDLARTSLITAFEHIGQVRDCRKLLAWLRALVRNCHRMRIRGRLPPDRFVNLAELDLISGAADPLRLAQTNLALNALDQALRSLNPGLRAAFEARMLGGLNTTETARELGITPMAVRTRLRRARNCLRGSGNLSATCI